MADSAAPLVKAPASSTPTTDSNAALAEIGPGIREELAGLQTGAVHFSGDWSLERAKEWAAEHIGRRTSGRVAVLAVSIDTEPARVRPHAARQGWSQIDLYWTGDRSAHDFEAPAARAFGVNGVPEAILIGANGRLLWRGSGRVRRTWR